MNYLRLLLMLLCQRRAIPALQPNFIVQIALYLILKKREERKVARKFWVRPIFQEETRLAQGDSDNLAREMENYDTDKYRNYFRMTPDVFKHLLNLVEPYIAKQTVYRNPIPARTRLQMTLRYLASGDSMMSISYAYRIGHNTSSKIIRETCEAIWTVLKDTIFIEAKAETWSKIATEFNDLWQFPNCVGAVDGKHVVMQVIYIYSSTNPWAICKL